MAEAKLLDKRSFYVEVIQISGIIIIVRGDGTSWILIIFMFFDFSVSASAILQGNQRYYGVPATNNLQVELDKNYSDSLLNRIYPNLVHV